jgi:hypothetical protein
MQMFFSSRDRERLEKIDEMATRLSVMVPNNSEIIKEHIRWCNKLQFAQLMLLIGTVGMLLKIVLKIG